MAVKSNTEVHREKERWREIEMICINQPLFDAGGQQPSANRRTEVKLKKSTVLFKKTLLPEINNNNNNYSKQHIS